MTKTNVSKLNKKGLAFAAVVLLLAAALFVGAGAATGDMNNTPANAVAKIGEEYYSTLALAVADANATDTIVLLKNVDLTEQLTIKKAITIDGAGHIIAAKKGSNWSTANGSKNLVLVQSVNAPVTLKSITFDCKNGDYTAATGVQFYALADTIENKLENVTITNSRGYSLYVNGATVTATDLTTNGSEWGVGIDVQPGSGVTHKSILKIDTLDKIADPIQISDEACGTNVVVIIDAVYGKYVLYKYDNTEYKKRYIYINDVTKQKYDAGELGMVASVTNVTGDEPKVAYHPDLAKAVENAASGATIKLAGDVALSTQLLIDKPLTIDGKKSDTEVYTISAVSSGYTDSAIEALKGHLVQVDNSTQGTGLSAPVTIRNVKIDATNVKGSKIGALQICESHPVYRDVEHVLENVEILNSGKESLRITSAKVKITGLKTSGSEWGSGIDAQAGSSGTEPSKVIWPKSIITIDTLKNIGDRDQIKDDGAVDAKYKDSLAKVTVTDDDAKMYRFVEFKAKKSGDPKTVWPTCDVWLNAASVLANGAIEVTPADSSTVLLYSKDIPDVLVVAINGKNDMTGADAGDTIKLLKNLTDCPGISVPSEKNFTLDFNGKTVTFKNPAAGSTGTENQALQLLKDSTIVLKNGTIQIDAGNPSLTPGGNPYCYPISRIIQNYANLTLTDMVLDGTNLHADYKIYKGETAPTRPSVAVAFNNGTVSLTGSTSIKAMSGGYAFEVDWWPSSYSDGTQVTVNTTGTFDGKIRFIRDSNTEVITDVKNTLTITNGKFTGSIDVNGEKDGAADAEYEAIAKEKVTISGGTFQVDPSKYVATGYHWDSSTKQVVKDTPKYTVTFDADNGTPLSYVTVEQGQTVSEPSPAPEKTGFHFAGWFNGDELYNFATPVMSDLTLTADWSEDEPETYFVSFDTMGGSEAPADQEVIAGGYVTKPADPTKGTDKFLGWFWGEVLYDFNTPVTSSFTLVAHWKVTEVPADPTKIIDEIKESGGDVVVEVTGDNKDNVRNLVEQAQQDEKTAGKVQLEVTSGNKETIAEVINEAEIQTAVPVVVTKDNGANVKEVLDKVEDKSKVSLPVSGDGTNIVTVLEISGNEKYEAAKVAVPEVIVVSTPVEMTLDSKKENYTYTLYEIAEAAANGDSAQQLTLNLVKEDLNVQDAVTILGNIDRDINVIELPDNVVITNSPEENQYDLVVAGDATAKIVLSEMTGVEAAAVSTKKETTIEKKQPILPEQPDVTRGYENNEVHTVFQIVVPEVRDEAVTVTFEVTLKEGQDQSILSNFYLKHYNGTGWDEKQIHQSVAPKKVEGTENTYKLTFTLKEFSPYALVSETAIPRSSGSSSSGGASTWATVAPTPGTPATTPTPGETPGVKPIETPSGSSAKTPAPFLGILAGLGAAAAVFGLRRK